MSSRPLDVVLSYWAAEGRKDIEEVLRHFAADAVFASPMMDLCGRDNIRRFYERMIGDYESICVRPLRSVEAGQDVVMEYECELKRPGGEPRLARGCNVFRVHDGRIESLRSYFNPADF